MRASQPWISLPADGPRRLSFEIAYAFRRNEKSPDGSVGVVRSEIAPLHVEPGNASGVPPGFEDIPADAAIPQLLRQMKVLPFGDMPELMAVFFKVIVKEVLIPKSRAASHRKGGRCQEDSRERKRFIASR
jgi:hypothetical protein